MEQKKSFVHLMMLLLFLSCLLTTARPHELRSRKMLLPAEAADQQLTSKEMVKRAGWVDRKERMDVEINDYPGSGANNRHDPRGRP